MIFGPYPPPEPPQLTGQQILVLITIWLAIADLGLWLALHVG